VRNLRQVIITILLFAPAAAVATSQPSPAVRRPCIADAKKFCSSVLFQPERRRECMREHRMQLSERCRTAIVEERMRRMQKSGGERE
jgi:hypothetical protein